MSSPSPSPTSNIIASAISLINKQFPTFKNIKHDSLHNVLKNSLVDIHNICKSKRANTVENVIQALLATSVLQVSDTADDVYILNKICREKNEEEEEDCEDEEEEEEEEEQRVNEAIIVDRLDDVVGYMLILQASVKNTNQKLDKIIDLLKTHNSNYEDTTRALIEATRENSRLLQENNQLRKVNTPMFPSFHNR